MAQDKGASKDEKLGAAFAWQYPTLWRQQPHQNNHDEFADESQVASSSVLAPNPNPQGRKRASIPFSLGGVQTPPGSPSVVNQSSLAAETMSPRKSNGGNAYGTLTRVKDRDRIASSRQHTSNESSFGNNDKVLSQGVDQDAEATPSAPASWLTWGSMRVRNTISRGMSASLMGSEQPSDDTNGQQSWFATFPRASHVRKEDIDDGEVDKYTDEILQFCGHDSDKRAIITLAMPCLPPADLISHDALLERILARTLPLVSSEVGYTLILYASGAENIKGSPGIKTPWPGWTWCWRVWKGLGRSYRKNLKKLVIVHPTVFTRSLVRFVSTGSYFISPKFARKIVECNSFGDLQSHVSLSQLSIPARVLIYDLRVSEIEAELDPFCPEKDTKIPAVFQDCVQAIIGYQGQKPLVSLEGVFRVSPSNSQLAALKYAYNLKVRIETSKIFSKDPHLPAALLKSFLRSIEPPLVQSSLYEIFEQCPLNSDQSTSSYVTRTILPALGNQIRQEIFRQVIECLHAVYTERERSRMDASNLAIVVAPSMVRSQDIARDIAVCAAPSTSPLGVSSPTAPTSRARKANLGVVLIYCIEHYKELYDVP